SSRRRHTRFDCDWSSDVCSSDLICTKRTPRSTRRRDKRQLAAKLPERDTSGPYKSSTWRGSRDTSISSGTDDCMRKAISYWAIRSEEHTSELQSQSNLVCRLLLE